MQDQLSDNHMPAVTKFVQFRPDSLGYNMLYLGRINNTKSKGHCDVIMVFCINFCVFVVYGQFIGCLPTICLLHS